MNYNSLRKIFIATCFITFSIGISAQSIGVRAGLNYSQFKGPLEEGESYGISTGFHFGLNYGYIVTKKFSVRAELLYAQIGTNHHYNSDGYYKIYQPYLEEEPEGFMFGNLETNVEISNAYINLPITANYQFHPKFEVLAGLSFNFLINPVGRGNLRFEPEGKPAEAFRQSLDYRYFKDEAKQATYNSGIGRSNPVAIIFEDRVVEIPRYVGAYYQFSEKSGGMFSVFDISTLAGFNYYINRGFFIGARASYGLLDVTKNKMDRSLRSLNDDNSLKLREDYDHNLNFEVSIGFKF